jgi:cell division inhibitor SulA
MQAKLRANQQSVQEKLSKELAERIKAEKRLTFHSYRTPNEIGKSIVEAVTEAGQVSKFIFDNDLEVLNHTLLDKLLNDSEAAAAWRDLDRVKSTGDLQESHVQGFFTTPGAHSCA